MFKNDPAVLFALQSRNDSLAKFWFLEPGKRDRFELSLVGRKAVVFNAEDLFTEMLAQQLMAIGLTVIVCKLEEFSSVYEESDIVIMGPGPGDPRNIADSRIINIQDGLKHLLSKKHPFFAVCLSHQVLCAELGLTLERRVPPNQGVQQSINFFGTEQLVGFYNTYVAKCDSIQEEYLNAKLIHVSWDQALHEIHALRGPHFASVQFHPESLLTQNGIDIIISCLKWILDI